jgi:hypothetical protein
MLRKAYHMHDDGSSDDAVIDEMRQRSNVFVQCVFTVFTLTFVALGLIAHHAPTWLPFPEGEPRFIADSFLCLASAYALTLYIWEWIYSPRTSVS